MTLPSKTLWLTFDDGPEDTYSPRVLDVLHHYRIFATFFCLGSQVEKFPTIVQRMHEEGHLVGNHSWDHPHLLDMPLDEVYQQVTKTSEAILRVIGYRPHLFRPPYGERSSPLVGHLANWEYHTVYWDIDSRDWQGISGPTISANVLGHLGAGGIILQHTGIHAKHTVDALPYMIEAAYALGYTFGQLPDLFAEPVEPPSGNVI